MRNKKGKENEKLIMALTVVVCATVVQAASFNWTSSGTNASKTFYGTDGNTIAGMTVYLFDAATVSQGDLLAGLRSGDTIADYTVVASQTLDTNSRLSAKGFEYGTAGETYSFYMAIVDGDNVFISANASDANAQASATTDVKFSGIKTATSANHGNASYSAAGWYQAVPEPTSGLLMLVGLAGLALRRRRA